MKYWYWLIGLTLVLSFAVPTQPGLAEVPPPAQSAHREILETPVPEIPLFLPDLQTLPPHHLVWRVSSSGEKILRFGNSVGNFGIGALEMQGEWREAQAESEHASIQVTQLIQTHTGTTVPLQVGIFEYHPIHGHWHWQGFSRYEVWSVNAWGEDDELVGISGKVGFCLRDIDAIITQADPPPETWSNRRRYGSCDWKKQGLSPGWIDRYDNHLDGQSIDLSQAGDGLYVLVSTANPDHLILESDLNNNTARMYFTIKGQDMRVLGENSPVKRVPGSVPHKIQ